MVENKILNVEELKNKFISYELLKEKMLLVDIVEYDCLDITEEYDKYSEKYDLDDDDVWAELCAKDEKFKFLEEYIASDDYIDNKITYLYNNEVKETICIGEYLHGRCDEFAYALAKKFGYKIAVFCASRPDGKFSNIVHAFCFKETEDENFFIDARGKSQSHTMWDIMDIYEEQYYPDQWYTATFNLEEILDFYKNICKFNLKKYSDKNLKDVYEYLELFKEKYQI